MKTRTKVIVAAGAAALLGSVAVAGASQADSRYSGEYRGGYGMHAMGHGEYRGGRMLYMFEAFDADSDGKVTQAEIDQVRAQRLSAFDADGDGKLTLEEYEALWVDAMRERMVDRFQSHDDDGDGLVTAEEFASPYDRMVSRMDRTGDGAISAEDMRWRDGSRRSDDDDDN